MSGANSALRLRQHVIRALSAFVWREPLSRRSSARAPRSEVIVTISDTLWTGLVARQFILSKVWRALPSALRVGGSCAAGGRSRNARPGLVSTRPHAHTAQYGLGRSAFSLPVMFSAHAPPRVGFWGMARRLSFASGRL